MRGEGRNRKEKKDNDRLAQSYIGTVSAVALLLLQVVVVVVVGDGWRELWEDCQPE